MTDQPIACTLTPEAMSGRRDLAAALAADALLDRRATARGLRLLLRDTRAIEQRVRELVAAESACCPFLDFELGREDGGLVLEITGPAEARPVIEMLFAGA